MAPPADPGFTTRIPADTDPEAHALQIEAYRRLGGSGRMAAAFRLSAAVRRTSMAGIKMRHPEYTPDQVKQALARLVLGDTVCREVWPDRELVSP
jgi:hypothetical protein